MRWITIIYSATQQSKDEKAGKELSMNIRIFQTMIFCGSLCCTLLILQDKFVIWCLKASAYFLRNEILESCVKALTSSHTFYGFVLPVADAPLMQVCRPYQADGPIHARYLGSEVFFYCLTCECTTFTSTGHTDWQ